MSGPIRKIVSEWLTQAEVKSKKEKRKEMTLEDALRDVILGKGFRGSSMSEVISKAEKWISKELSDMGVCASVNVEAKEYSFGEEVITLEVDCDGIKKEVYLELDIRAEVSDFS